jgi:hypothetical protein
MEKALRARPIRDLMTLHLLFGAVAAVLLFAPIQAAVGWRMLVIVVVYSTMIPFVGYLLGHTEWVKIWMFVMPLSIFQMIPDWFLSAQLEVLYFPSDGSPMIGTVPVYMAGLWAIPLFIIVYIGLRVQEERSVWETQAAVLISSFVLFVGAEATMWAIPAWYAQNVLTIGSVAAYIIIPELLLGSSAFIIYTMIRYYGHILKLFWSYIVMALYLGNACIFYFIVETVLLGG